MKELTQEDINRGIVNGVQPAVDKAASVLGKARPAPNFVQRAITKLFSFIWGLLCMPFLPVINVWRRS